MAPFATIYSYPGNFRVKRAHFVAALGGLELKDGDFTMGQTNTSPEFLSKWPLGKVPVLETADGFCLFENAAIASFLAVSGSKADQLLGGSENTVKSRALVTQWSYFAETELVANAMPGLLMCVLKLMPFDEGRYAFAASYFERAVKRVEMELEKSGGQFLVGDSVTLADVMVGGALAFAAGFLFDADMRQGAPRAVKYLEGLSAIPEWKQAWGEQALIEKRLKP